MGYYTNFELTIISGDDYKTDYEKELTATTQYSYLFEDEIKWYDHERDMKKFSKSHPNTLFLLEGDGEENGDLWRAWFKNGKMFKTKAKMIFEEFDESKLE